MNIKCYFFFSGYYMVTAASDVLTRYHIENRVVRAPAAMRNSCSFAVLINAGDADMAEYILKCKEICVIKKVCV